MNSLINKLIKKAIKNKRGYNMNTDAYQIKSIIDKIEYLIDEYKIKPEFIIQIYLIKELKDLNNSIEEYINYKYNE